MHWQARARSAGESSPAAQRPPRVPGDDHGTIMLDSLRVSHEWRASDIACWPVRRIGLECGAGRALVTRDES